MRNAVLVCSHYLQMWILFLIHLASAYGWLQSHRGYYERSFDGLNEKNVPDIYANLSCENSKFVILTGFQHTGLGSLIEAISQGAFIASGEEVVVLISEFPSPYLIDGQNHMGTFSTHYEPLTSCVLFKYKCEVPAITYVERHIEECFHVQEKWNLKHSEAPNDFSSRNLMRFIFKVNKNLLKYVFEVMEKINWPQPVIKTHNIASVHIRQGVPKNDWDFVRAGKYIWSAQDVLGVMAVLQNITNAASFLLLTEDISLSKQVDAMSKLYEFTIVSKDQSLIPDVVESQQFNYSLSNVMFTHEYASHELGHDCIREHSDVSCSHYKEAFSVLLDSVLPSFTQHFAGTFDSSFTRIIFKSMNEKSVPINLETMSCHRREGLTRNSLPHYVNEICFVSYYSHYTDFYGVDTTNLPERCAVPLGVENEGDTIRAYCIQRPEFKKEE